MELKQKIEKVAECLSGLATSVDSMSWQEKEKLEYLMESNRCALSLFYGGGADLGEMTNDDVVEYLAERKAMNSVLDGLFMEQYKVNADEVERKEQQTEYNIVIK